MVEGYESSWLKMANELAVLAGYWPLMTALLILPINILLFLQLSIDDITHYGDAYSAGNHGAAFSNLKVAMETANSSVVLPSVELSSSGGNSDELVYLIRKMATGNIQEFTQEGNLVCMCHQKGRNWTARKSFWFYFSFVFI